MRVHGIHVCKGVFFFSFSYLQDTCKTLGLEVRHVSSEKIILISVLIERAATTEVGTDWSVAQRGSTWSAISIRFC